MNFYFMFYQLLETVERMEAEARCLATHSLRISPRDGQTNRGLLEECGKKLKEIQRLMYSKSHISKVQLRRTSVLFEAVQVAQRRVLALAAALASRNEAAGDALWELLRRGQRDYEGLRSALSDRMAVPVLISLPKPEPGGNFVNVLENEHDLQKELVRLIERGIEIFDEERALTNQLNLVRKNLLETKRYVKRLLIKHMEESARPFLEHQNGEETPSLAAPPLRAVEPEKSPAGR